MIKNLTKELLDFYFAEHKEYFEESCGYPEGLYTRFAFLASDVFDLSPYDGDKDNEWGRIIYDVWCAIRDRKNFEYMDVDEKHYNDYLLVCQLLAWKDWIEWGTSIRSCWLEDHEERSCRVLFHIQMVSLSDERYDEEGVAYSIENVKVLLDWIAENEFQERK